MWVSWKNCDVIRFGIDVVDVRRWMERMAVWNRWRNALKWRLTCSSGWSESSVGNGTESWLKLVCFLILLNGCVVGKIKRFSSELPTPTVRAEESEIRYKPAGRRLVDLADADRFDGVEKAAVVPKSTRLILGETATGSNTTRLNDHIGFGAEGLL